MTEQTNVPSINESAAHATESLEYRTEVKQLLDILAHSLYTDREIFLRELISNASDALNRVQFEMLTNPDVHGADQELAIRIEVDPHAKIITISDSGIGMNRDELIRNLGTIAHSGARAFLQQAGSNGSGPGDGGENGENGRKRTLEEIIGQFGVGFYSVFMVASEVRVTSRSFRKEDRAWTWRSRGDRNFEIEPGERAERGTSIQILLKEDASEFASAWRLEQIIKKHSDYVSFPIYVSTTDSESGEPRIANRRTALWRQSPSSVDAEQYEEFYKQLTYDTEAPLLHIHMVTDAPVNLRAVLFVPAKRERGTLGMRPEQGLRLYSRKILIQERNKDLLPEFLRFVEGVVDSEDLPLNVSREMVQSNPVMRQVKRALTGRVLRELKSLAENDAERYVTFWEEFGIFLKEGAATDPSNQDSVVDLLRFKSTRSEEWISLSQYIERMGEDQKAIYYVLGEDLRSVRRSPHLDYFRARDIEVLYLVDPIDGFMTAMLREVHGKPLQNVDDAGLELPKGDEKAEDGESVEAPADQFAALVERFKKVLGDRVRDVRESKQLVGSPGRLVSPEDSFDRDLQRIRRLTEENYEAPKKLLELNRKHPLIVNLAKILASSPEEPVVDASIEQLFDNLLLLDGLHNSPADMVERIQLLMEAAVSAKAGS